MIGSKGRFWGGSEKQSALELTWRQAADCSRGGFQPPEMHNRRWWTAVYVGSLATSANTTTLMSYMCDTYGCDCSSRIITDVIIVMSMNRSVARNSFPVFGMSSIYQYVKKLMPTGTANHNAGIWTQDDFMAVTYEMVYKINCVNLNLKETILVWTVLFKFDFSCWRRTQRILWHIKHHWLTQNVTRASNNNCNNNDSNGNKTTETKMTIMVKTRHIYYSTETHNTGKAWHRNLQKQ